MGWQVLGHKAERDVNQSTLTPDIRGADALLEEAALIRAVQRGSQEEYRVLVMRYKDMVFNLIKRQVGQHHVAEDIAQEVFVRAYFGIKKFRLDSKFSTWLTRIALNQTNSYFSTKRYKQQSRTESFDGKLHEMSDIEKKAETEEEAEKNAMLATFREALGCLKPKFRDVLVLCGLEGRSYQEAAEILGVPVGTIRSRLNKARLLVKDEIHNNS
ncbi:MAG: sigma-70 family RNA polymerase sigma factor [Deltaproteobacteria bacterium]|nr:sigma-70 family RNA polymerase sigma factor [Deltaproteobacteria bacterium]